MLWFLTKEQNFDQKEDSMDDLGQRYDTDGLKYQTLRFYK